MHNQRQISLFSLILMILSAVFGFQNVAVAYYQMGYASIIWYVLAAILFFLPASLMFAEYGAAITNDRGGVYTWLADSIGEKWAFIGTFIWICDWILNLVNYAPKLLISLSTLISGRDETGTWRLLGLNSTQTIGVLSILLIIFLTWLACLGLRSVTTIASLGGLLITVTVLLFCTFSALLIFFNRGQLAQPLHTSSWFVSPNPNFRSPTALVSFIVYAIFAYGGIESVSGVIDKLKNPGKTFPRAMVISAVLMTLMYSVSIFLCGYSINWRAVLGRGHVNLANILFILMDNLGWTFARSVGMSIPISTNVGYLFARFTGLAMFMGGFGCIVILTYSPIKAFILGSPRKLWPRKMTHLNAHQMPANAMWMQAGIVCLILLATSFGGSNAQRFYLILTNMNNVASVFPYLFLIAAFPAFKRIKRFNRPFVFYHSSKTVWVTVIIVLIVLIFSIIFNLLQPLLAHDYQTAFWNFVGPLFFGGVAYWFYRLSLKKN